MLLHATGQNLQLPVNYIFLQFFESWYNRNTNKAERINRLVEIFKKEGNVNHPSPGDRNFRFSNEVWASYDVKEQEDILMNYRLAYCGYGEVNWCEALGTVLANDEVINGVSERGGFPVVRKKLRQWYLRITEYADRLLDGLEKVDFSESMKDMQSNWIGKSFGAELDFEPEIPEGKKPIRVYTTRPDTIFGVDFLVVSPEHESVADYTTPEQQETISNYIEYVNSRSERERMAEKKITGAFTGSYCRHPFSEKRIPVWISEYVLAGYGTGAIMAVPCGDERDHKFARHFELPITNIIGDFYDGSEANPTKDAVLQNSGFLNGLVMRDAIGVALEKKKVEEPPTVAEAKPVIKSLPPKVIVQPPTVEEMFSRRSKKFVTEIPLAGDTVELSFYDHAEIDGDSISLFLNNQLLQKNILLKASAFTVKLAVKELSDQNEMTMVAENLGSIPPNTSLMIAYINGVRYEARLESDENSSAMIRFVKPAVSINSSR